jgi:hypothetical protein
MSTLSQFFGSSIQPSCNLTLNTLCANRITVCQNGFVLLDKFTQGPNEVGCYFEGGHVICKASSNSWIVSPRCSEVSRTWYCRDDASTVANLCTSCTGWFVPTISQLQNPGYCCRTYWDLFSSTCYWSSTEPSADTACFLNFANGNANSTFGKSATFCVRAFRCVTY